MSSWPLHRIRIKLKFYESQYGKCFDITKIVFWIVSRNFKTKWIWRQNQNGLMKMDDPGINLLRSLY